MQKLKLTVLDKMILNKATSAEVDFVIYTSRYLSDSGIVRGVYYKEICKQLGVSHQTFYDLKVSLEKKGIIKASKNNFTDWDIKILDNDFTYPESYKEGYINTNHDIFYKKEFFSMKAGEKLLAMQFMKISFAGRGFYNIGVNKFYDKYPTLFGVTKRVIQNYMTTLKKFFNIHIKEGEYWITPLAKIFRSNGAVYNRTEVDNYNNHLGETVCRREKIKFNNKTLKDTVDLLKQYRKVFEDKTEELEKYLIKAIKKSIEKANETIKNPHKWERVLQPSLVHKILQEEIYAGAN